MAHSKSQSQLKSRQFYRRRSRCQVSAIAKTRLKEATKHSNDGMDLLETQVSDLRSFLDPNANAANPSQAPAPTPQPPQLVHAPANALSAPYGDNSAHNSPISFSPPPGPGSASGSHRNNSAASSSKNKRNASDVMSDDGANSSKQQRAKRNRVCDPFVALFFLPRSNHFHFIHSLSPISRTCLCHD